MSFRVCGWDLAVAADQLALSIDAFFFLFFESVLKPESIVDPLVRHVLGDLLLDQDEPISDRVETPVVRLAESLEFVLFAQDRGDQELFEMLLAFSRERSAQLIGDRDDPFEDVRRAETIKNALSLEEVRPRQDAATNERSSRQLFLKRKKSSECVYLNRHGPTLGLGAVPSEADHRNLCSRLGCVSFLDVVIHCPADQQGTDVGIYCAYDDLRLFIGSSDVSRQVLDEYIGFGA